MDVKLASFRNDWYHPGRSRLWQVCWFLLGRPVLKCGILPFSGIRVRLLRMFGAQIGEGVTIRPGVRIKNPWRLIVGDNCWIGEDCWIDNIGDVTIGDDVCLSQGAYLCTGNHDWSDTSFGLIVKPIRLESGSWVGARALIGPGVSLGQCAVAAAGSVVQRSVPDFEIHSGNPASFVRRRRISKGRVNAATIPVQNGAKTFSTGA
jgi:putative colanic acid biosynthesis acetyltransferase WcaF